MRPSPLSWISSFLTLKSVSSADEPPSFTDLPSEMLDAIVRQVVVSQKGSLRGYVDWLAGNRWTWPWTDVGMPMLRELAEEERSLELEDYKQCVRKQQTLKTVRTFVRIRSRLPIDCTGMEAEELRELAGRLGSSYEECASLSESSTWKKACMAGLFGFNTLIKLLPHLSEDFCSHNKDLLLQTAVFIGDIDSVNAIIGFFSLSKYDVLNMVSELDLVFSNDGAFFRELFEFLPSLMGKTLGLIREACSLNRLDILTCILEVAKPVELDERDQIIGSLWRLEIFKTDGINYHYTGGKRLYCILKLAAQHGHLSMIRFLWPMLDKTPSKANNVVHAMMIEAGRNNHRSVLEFLLWHSGTSCMQLAQKYANNSLKIAVKKGNVEIIELLTRKNNDGTFVSPGLWLPTLNKWEFNYAVKTDKNWVGIRYVVELKKKGDPRFADFELVDRDNTVLCGACEAGNYGVVDYLFQKAPNGQFLFPLTNPAAQNNAPFLGACFGGHVRIVEKLLERDKSGDYIYKGVDPSVQDYEGVVRACRKGYLDVVKVFLEVKDGKYVLPEMDSMDIARALTAAIDGDKITIVEFLFERKDGKYVLPRMECVNFTRWLKRAIMWNRMEMVRFFLKMKYGNYVLPGIRVTEDMLTMVNQSPEMTSLLKKCLRQQLIDA